VLSARVWLARIRLERGDAASALDIVRAVLAEMPAFHYWRPLAQLVLAEALDAAGEKDAARVELARARDSMLAGAARLKNPEFSRSHLAHMPDNPRVAELARVLLG
jgi:hypothetical protein